jgi:hypothetical protein
VLLAALSRECLTKMDLSWLRASPPSIPGSTGEAVESPQSAAGVQVPRGMIESASGPPTGALLSRVSSRQVVASDARLLQPQRRTVGASHLTWRCASPMAVRCSMETRRRVASSAGSSFRSP